MIPFWRKDFATGPSRIWKPWLERNGARCSDLGHTAVLRVSFLRGLRVLRVNLRRRDACLQTAQCRSLDSLRSLGMTTNGVRVARL